MRRWIGLVGVVVLATVGVCDLRGAKSFKIERLGKVVDSQGICALQPRLR